MRLRKPLFQKPISLGHHLPGTRRPSMLGEEIEDQSENDPEEEHATVSHEAVIGIIQVCDEEGAMDPRACEVSAFLMKETFNDQILNHCIAVYEAAVSVIKSKGKDLFENEPISLHELKEMQRSRGGSLDLQDVTIWPQEEWKQKPPEPPPQFDETEDEDEDEDEEKEKTEDETPGELGARSPQGRFGEEDLDKYATQKLEQNIIVGFKRVLKSVNQGVSELQRVLTLLHDEIQNLDGEAAVDYANGILEMVFAEGEQISIDRAYLYP